MKMIVIILGSLLLITHSFAEPPVPQVTPEIQKKQEITPEQQKRIDLIAQGEELHGKHCVRCHGDWVYKRANSRIKDYAALTVHVQRCATNLRKFLRKKWENPEISAVSAYLNHQYYLFETQ